MAKKVAKFVPVKGLKVLQVNFINLICMINRLP
jgi:hypothetical protein